MPLSADLTVRFAQGTGQVPFRLVQAQGDQGDHFPFVHAPPATQDPDRLPLGRNWIPVDRIRLGRVTLRLYAPETIQPLLQHLDAPDPAIVENLEYSLFNTRYRWWDLGWDGRAIVARGRSSEVIREMLTFNGDLSAQIASWYDDPVVTVLSQSDFVDADGAAAPAPVAGPGGIFLADRPVFGGLAVEYTASYSVYWVYYDLRGAAVPFDVAEIRDAGGNVVGRRGVWAWAANASDQFFPEFFVTARYGSQMEMLAVRSAVQDYAFGGGTRAQEEDQQDEVTVWRERSVTTVPVHVTNPDDASQFVDVDRVQQIEFQNGTGKRIVLERAI